MSLTNSRVRVRRSRVQDGLDIGQTTLITQDDQGFYGTCKSDGFGSLKTKAGDETLFGVQKVAKLTTLIQNFTPYGIINNQSYTVFTATGGTVIPNPAGGGIQLNISNSIGSYAVIRSKKVMKFRPGYTNLVQFDCTFDAPLAYNLQFGGIGNAGSDFYFCYNGTDFAVRKSTGGLLHAVKLTITTAANSSETATVTLNDVEFEVNLTNASSDKNFTSHELSNGAYTSWGVESIDDVIYFYFRGAAAAKSGTYSFSSDGAATGTFTTLTTGAPLTTTYTNQADWNGTSKMIQNLDATTRNAYSIEYSTGNTIFKVLNPDTGMYELCHTLSSTNEADSEFVNQPNMFIQRGIASLGSTTAKSFNVSGTFGGTYGPILLDASHQPIYGTSNEKSISANTETVLIVIKNREVINGFINQAEIFLERMSVSVDGTAPVQFKIISNPTTLGASTTDDFSQYMFVDEDNSISLCDTTSNTYTGGSILDQFYLPKDGSIYSDFHGNGMHLSQSDVLIVTAKSTSTSTIDISLTLLEDV